jgi:hypothetical protein
VPAEAAEARTDVLESVRDMASAKSLILSAADILAAGHAPEAHRQCLAVGIRRRMVLAVVGS